MATSETRGIENPYQPPADLGGCDPLSSNTAMFWRKGRILVMQKNARFPDRCVKSNVPTRRRIKRRLSWHTPWLYLLLLIHILIYIVVALIVSKRATIYVGLSDKWFARRRNALLIAWSSILASIFLSIVLVIRTGEEFLAEIFLGAAVLFLFGALWGSFRTRIVVPVRITGEYIWLKGVCPEFLEGLPEWPYSP